MIVLGGVGLIAVIALGSSTTTTTTKASSPSPGTSGQAKEPDRGDFVAFYETPKSPTYKAMETSLKSDKVMETLAASLNEGLALPTDVKLGFAECGTPNAFYASAKKTVVICYEILELANKVLDGDSAAAGQTVVFLFFHELGHAMIDVYQLPVTGREEDAADGVAALLMISGGESEIVVAAAKFFYALGNARTKINFADEHSLDQQRFYNSLCWVYGSDPSKYKSWVPNGVLPAARAERCPDEYKQLDKSWTKLLTPYVKQ